MKVYLAHNYAAKQLLRGVRDKLNVVGISVTSRWIDQPDGETYAPTMLSEEALNDVQDVLAADTVVLFTDNFGDRPGRGKYVELGIAIAAYKTIVLCGTEQGTCVFYYLPNLKRVFDPTKLVEELVRYAIPTPQPKPLS